MNNFCLHASSDQLQPQRDALKFVEVIKSLSNQLELALTHLTLSGSDIESTDEVSIEIELTPSNIVSSLPLDQYSITELSVRSSRIDGVEESYWDMYAEIAPSTFVDECYHAYIQFPSYHVSNLAPNSQFSFIRNLLESLAGIAPLDYALVTLMDDSKFPSTYFRGIYNSRLSYDEILNQAMWQGHIAERKRKLRGIYWGNLMGALHLSSLKDKANFEKRLASLVGYEFIVKINNDNLFFLLPAIATETSSNNIVHLVEALLREYDLLMQPDGKDKHRANRLV
jgi:hypothetical protein